LGTLGDNNHDAIGKGRWPQIRGSSPMFGADQVMQIRAAFEGERCSFRRLAIRYGVAVPTIARIIRGEGGYGAM
jgi:hypothetical protein